MHPFEPELRLCADDWLVSRFAPLSLQALNAKAAMLERLDNKYVVPAPVLAAAAAELAGLFDVLEIQGRRSFTYDTCYFDDPELRSYHDHHQGRRQRVKVRVRRYVEAALCFVEVKLKDRRGGTVKKRMPCAPALFGGLDDEALAHVESAHRLQYGRPFGKALAPVLSVQYRRITLVARAGGERMTIDSSIRFKGLAGGDSGPSRERCTDDERYIVETKSAHGHGIADAVLRRHHQRPTPACSKYCLGMSLTGAVERFNRFRPALRKLGTLPEQPLTSHRAQAVCEQARGESGRSTPGAGQAPAACLAPKRQPRTSGEEPCTDPACLPSDGP